MEVMLQGHPSKKEELGNNLNTSKERALSVSILCHSLKYPRSSFYLSIMEVIDGRTERRKQNKDF